MTNTTSNQIQLDKQRRLAVQSRIEGLTIAETTAKSGLSAPTVIAAYKAYLSGGWEAVKVKPRGRPSGNKQLSAARQTELRSLLLTTKPDHADKSDALWSVQLANQWLMAHGYTLTDRSTAAYLERWNLAAPYPLDVLKNSSISTDRLWLERDYPALLKQSKECNAKLYWMGVTVKDNFTLIHVHTPRKKYLWMAVPDSNPIVPACIDFLNRLSHTAKSRAMVILQGIDIARVSTIQTWLYEHKDDIQVIPIKPAITDQPTDHLHDSAETRDTRMTATARQSLNSEDAPEQTVLRSISTSRHPNTLTHLQRLEAESIHIMREVVAEADNPVMLYSIGKDSAVMLHLAMKAFYPAKPPFPLLHVDTNWKFREMYEFRDKTVKELGVELLTHINPEGREKNVNPFTHGSALHTDIMKTEGLKQALDKHQFDVAFGGARRDEEKSRAKERIFSFRSAQHRWEPKNQRPELWRLYNARKQKGESIRVFPISNWTELDVWQYIKQENIPIVPLYFAAQRPIVERDGSLIMVDDDRMPLQPGEAPIMRNVRFRTLGCYPLTGAVESNATTLSGIIQEMLLTRTSERQGRTIDHDSSASMEKKKQEGYF